jgi:DeoR/GlpR family transcriptional regulator of sugar metabolism
MLAAERLVILQNLLKQRKYLTTNEIMYMFSISTMTAWRDIKSLVEQGYARRLHGGVEFMEVIKEQEGLAGPRTNIMSDDDFLHKFNDQRKRAIGQYVADHILQNGESVIFEGGSTVSYIIPYLHKPDLIMLTNGLNTLTLALQYQTIDTILCCGGLLNQQNKIFIGPQAENFFNTYRVDRIFISAFGLTIADGFCDQTPLYDSMKKTMCQRGKQVIALLDSQKIGRKAMTQVLRLNEVDLIITNNDANPNIVQQIKKLGVNVITV